MFNSTARSLLASSLRAKPTARNPFNCLSSRTIVTVKEIKYSVTATATGAGRAGRVKSNGTALSLAFPKELPGPGGRGQNPEQLFALGYAACFLESIHITARLLGKKLVRKKTIVHATVHLGTPDDLPGFGLAVDIKVEGIDKENLKAAHEFCPYSRALSKGAVVKVSQA